MHETWHEVQKPSSSCRICFDKKLQDTDTAHIKFVGAANAWLAIVAGLADGRVVVIRGDACLVGRLLPTASCVLT